MLKVAKFNSKGEKSGELTLPKFLEAKKPNMNVLAQAIRVYEDRQHPGNSKVKTRSEVAVSTRKIYRQKGTGGARHGAKSAPIFVGGGVAHGPKGVKRELKLSNSIKKLALHTALNVKVKNGDVFAVDNLNKVTKSKEADQLLVKLTGSIKPIPTMVALSKENNKVGLAFRNLRNLKVKLFNSLSAYDLVNYKYLVLDSDAFAKEEKEKTDGAKKVQKTAKTKK